MEDQRATEISLDRPEADMLRLRIDVRACRLRTRPGKGETCVAATYDDPRAPLTRVCHARL